jgi:transposase
LTPHARKSVQRKRETQAICGIGRTNEEIIHALHQVEGGEKVTELCRRLGVSEQTFYQWKKQFAGLGLTELRERSDRASAGASPEARECESWQTSKTGLCPWGAY